MLCRCICHVLLCCDICICCSFIELKLLFFLLSQEKNETFYSYCIVPYELNRDNVIPLLPLIYSSNCCCDDDSDLKRLRFQAYYYHFVFALQHSWCCLQSIECRFFQKNEDKFCKIDISPTNSADYSGVFTFVGIRKYLLGMSFLWE